MHGIEYSLSRQTTGTFFYFYMQVQPDCGDGVELSALYADSEKGSAEVLQAAENATRSL